MPLKHRRSRIGIPPPGGGSVTILSPTAGQSLTGPVKLRGYAILPGTMTAVAISVDGDAYRPASFDIVGNRWKVSWHTGTVSPGNRVVTIRATDHLGNNAFSSVTVSVTATATTPGIHLLRLGTTGYFATSNKNKFSTLIVGQSNNSADPVAGSAAADAGTYSSRHLIWMLGTTFRLGPGDGQGVSGDEIVANNWALRDSSGALCQYPGDPAQFLTDVGNVDYQNRLIERFLTVIFPRFPNADGCLCDDVQNRWFSNQVSVTYPTNALYRNNGLIPFIRRVGKALTDAGYYMAGNMTAFDTNAEAPGNSVNDGTQWINFMKQLAPYMDGMAYEYFMRAGSGLPVRKLGTVNYYEFWLEWEKQIAECDKAGVDLLGWLELDAMTETAVMTYGKASFLLDWDARGGSSMGISCPFTVHASTLDEWDAAYTLPVGLPTGVKDQPQPGLWRKFFTGTGTGTIIVLVNANQSGLTLVQDGKSVAPGTAFIGLL